MKFVITGASGFIGRHVLDSLNARGHEIVALTRDRGRLVERPGLRVLQTDYSTIAPILTSGCVVIHLAAIRNNSGASREAMKEVNANLAERIARASVAAGVSRFVYVSSALVLGSSAVSLDESSATLGGSDDPYIASRIAGLQAVRAVGSLPLVTVLPTIVFGPDHPLARNRVTSHMRRLLRRPWRVAIRGANAARNLVFVDDVVSSIVEGAEAPAGDLRLVAGENITQEDFEQMVYATSGRRPAPQVIIPRGVAFAASRAADAVTGAQNGWARRLDTLFAPWCFRPSPGFTPVRSGIERTMSAS